MADVGRRYVVSDGFEEKGECLLQLREGLHTILYLLLNELSLFALETLVL